MKKETPGSVACEAKMHKKIGYALPLIRRRSGKSPKNGQKNFKKVEKKYCITGKNPVE